MNTIALCLAMTGQAGGTGGQGSTFGFFLPLILIFAIMYMLVFRPQAKKQKEHKGMLDTLDKGDKVQTAGGIYGTVAGIKEKENIIILQIAKDVKIEISKSSVARKFTTEAVKK